MGQYIDKSALVAWIERFSCQEYNSFCDKLLDYIDNLEVKGVGLEEEIEFSLPKPALGWNEDYFGKSDPAYSMEQMKEFAKHFFELGLKAQKEEKV